MCKPRPRLSWTVVADWDETITVNDTIELLAESTHFHKMFCMPPFAYFKKAYMDAYTKYQTQFGPRTTLQEEIRFHEGMREVEMASIRKLERHRYFLRLDDAVFESIAPKVELREGFKEFHDYTIRHEIPFVILSANWSRRLIEEALWHHGIDATYVDIIVNDLETINGFTTGKMPGNVRTAIDKLQYIKNFRKESNVLYVGDSTTDLLAMVEADLGVGVPGLAVLDAAKRIGERVEELLWRELKHELERRLAETKA